MKIFYRVNKARIIACLFAIISVSCNSKKNKQDYNRISLERYYKANLSNTITELQNIVLSEKVGEQEQYYKKARGFFKRIEPILAFLDINNYKSLNAPNILKVEEEDITDVKINKPFGFQVIEETLFDDEVNQNELKSVVELTKNRLKLIQNNTKLFTKDYHVLWLLRDQISRTALTGITGFDSPVLEQSLKEAKDVYKTIKFILETYKGKFKNKELYNQWLQEIDNTNTNLKGEFNEFNRYEFIKKHTHKQLDLLVKTAKDWGVKFPFKLALNDEATSLFSMNTLNIDFFSDPILKNKNFTKKSELGKKLFNDKRLSKNETMSCATCHQKDKAFTDGLVTFSKQKRNTPILTYSAFQKAFFYDGRSGSLEGQIISVVDNKDEFHSNLKDLENLVKKDSSYASQFSKLYGKANNMVIRNAIATYIKSLNKFNSKFDDNINGKENTLTEQETEGFNLFMGKAKCATCHFPPTFNGTVPPNYNDTEFEAIGVPNLKQNALSEDLGRYNVFKTEERKHFFKTPTIRNIEKTAPYMHNGTYKNLEKVMDFYNNGGGIGLGFKLEYQTLPPDSLHLSKKEIDAVIAFMKTLSDK